MTECQIFNYLVKELNKKCFTLQVYSSITDNSYYIRIDFGTIGIIRISDHPGDTDLGSNFHIGSYIHEKYIDEENDIYYYDVDSVKDLLNKIVNIKSNKLKKCKKSYKESMLNNVMSQNNTADFWTTARLIGEKIKI